MLPMRELVCYPRAGGQVVSCWRVSLAGRQSTRYVGSRERNRHAGLRTIVAVCTESNVYFRQKAIPEVLPGWIPGVDWWACRLTCW